MKPALLFAFSAAAILLTLTVCAAESTDPPTVVEDIVVKNSTSQVEGSSGATCSCDNSEAPVCASNGVTYKNSCRFDCTKKRVKRLRIVKRGQCSGVTLNQYRGSPGRRPAPAPSSVDSIFNSFFKS